MADHVFQPKAVQRFWRRQVGQDRHVAEPLMRPMSMIVANPLVEDMPQVLFAKDNEPIETLSLDPLHPSFRERIQIRTQWRNGPEFYAVGFENGAELLGELAVPVAHDMSGLVFVRFFVEDHRHILSLLGHPETIGIRRHAGDVNATRVDMQEEEHVVRHRTTKRPDLLGELKPQTLAVLAGDNRLILQ